MKWLFLMIGLGCAPVLAAETVVLVQSSDYAGSASYDIRNASEFKSLQVVLAEEANLFPRVLQQASKVWGQDPAHAGKSFPTGAIHTRKASVIGVPFMSFDKAKARLDVLERKAATKPGTAGRTESSARQESQREAVMIFRKALEQVRQADAHEVASAALRRGEASLLADQNPVATEWGTEPHEVYSGSGARVCDWGSAGNMGLHWPDERKIVKAIDPVFVLPEGKRYNSDMTNAFAVAGEWMTGVGVYARRASFYHWIEYDIPAGAKRFSANLYVTDDPRGFQWWANANQQFVFQVLVDGQEVDRVERVRTALEYGTGELLKNLEIPLPAGAKKIRFRVINSGWGDGNSNTELVLNNAAFFSKSKP